MPCDSQFSYRFGVAALFFTLSQLSFKADNSRFECAFILIMRRQKYVKSVMEWIWRSAVLLRRWVKENELKMTRNRWLICGLVALLLLSMLHIEASGKLIFCKNCRTTRALADPLKHSPNTSEIIINTGNIINAPSKCKPGYVPDKRNICRRVVYSKKK